MRSAPWHLLPSLAGLLAACGASPANPDGQRDAASVETIVEVAPEAPAIEAAADVAMESPAAEVAGPEVAMTQDAGPPPVDAPGGEPAPEVAPRPSLIGDLYCPAGVAAGTNPLPADKTPRVVPIAPTGGIMFLEGPVWLADRGVLLLSEWNGGHRILQVTPPQTVEVFLPATGSNGLTVTPDGASLLVISETQGKAVSRVGLADKAPQALVQTFNGEAFVQPNDLAVRADGTIFFTDYQAGRLYRRAVDGKLSLLTSATHANGVALSPDEKTLYLNSDARTIRYPLAADGSLGSGADLVTGLKGADGLAVDCAGNVYVAQNAGGAIVVVSAAGAKLGELTGLPMTVTNAAFGGPDRRRLYITTGSALYSVELLVPGLPS
jgi:gluconolactonase